MLEILDMLCVVFLKLGKGLFEIAGGAAGLITATFGWKQVEGIKYVDSCEGNAEDPLPLPIAFKEDKAPLPLLDECCPPIPSCPSPVDKAPSLDARDVIDFPWICAGAGGDLLGVKLADLSPAESRERLGDGRDPMLKCVEGLAGELIKLCGGRSTEGLANMCRESGLLLFIAKSSFWYLKNTIEKGKYSH